MKNIIVAILTLAILGLMGVTFMGGGAYQGGERGKIIKDFDSKSTVSGTKAKSIDEKNDRDKEMDKLSALRDKAGNSGAFKVSHEYKSKCASCHGVNGSGEQNGKALMGSKLFGQSEAKIYKDLADFKSGRRENMIMKGLLLGLNDEDLKRFAKEIGEFPARADAKKEQ